jgi:hypothetical protein
MKKDSSDAINDAFEKERAGLLGNFESMTETLL